MKLTVWIAALLSFATVAKAGEPTFPGADSFPISHLGTDAELLRALYGNGLPLCPSCKLTPKGRWSWRDGQNVQHVGFVVAAEPNPNEASHADGAYIGMVDLMETGRGWVIAGGSPIAQVTSGSFGQAPQVEIASIGKFGMAVITKPASQNQGEMHQNMDLFIERRGTHEFKQVLSVPITVDNSGKCESDQCRKDDYTSDVQLSPEGNALYVRITKTPYRGTTMFRDYTIIP